MKKLNIKRLIRNVSSILIIVSLVLSPLFLQPKKAEAQYAVSVVASVTDFLVKAGNLVLDNISKFSAFISNYLDSLRVKEYVLDPIAKGLARAIRKAIVQSVLSWVRNGFQGNPAFVQDPKNFFKRIADNEIGRFIYGSDLRWMCSPFRLQIQRAIVRNYSYFDTNQCTLTQVLDNFKGFTDSVNNELGSLGGWDMWAQVSGSPSNNPYGAYALAGIQIDAKISGELNKEQNILNWNKGFMSWKDPSCVAERTENKRLQETRDQYAGEGEGETLPQTVTVDAADNANFSDQVQGNTDPESCPIITPGTVIVDQLNKSLGSEIDELVAADEINEALTGLILSLVQQALGGNGGLAGSAVFSGADYSSQIEAQERDIFTQGKNDLIDNLVGRVDVENQYISVKNQTIFTIESSAGRVGSVISCYQGKIATSSNLTLSGSDRQFAENEIKNASSTMGIILSYQSGMKRDITIAESNIVNLNKLSDSVTNLPFERRDQLTFLSQQFSNLFAKVHHEGDVLSAEHERDYTIPERLKTINEASDKKLTECSDFPRSYDNNSGGSD